MSSQEARLRAAACVPPGRTIEFASDIARIPVRDVLREMWPYNVPLLATLALITLFPALTTWIPRLAVGN